MKSRRFFILAIAWAVLFLYSGSGCAQSFITTDDLKISALPELEINRQISLIQSCRLLNNPQYYCIESDDTWAGWHAVFQDIDLWVLGPTDAQTPGIITRIIISRPGIATNRGIKVGDSEAKLHSVYGEAGYTASSGGLTWHKYFVSNALTRILFGIDNSGTVVKIGYSLAAAGL
jgi:hypothetical protein